MEKMSDGGSAFPELGWERSYDGGPGHYTTGGMSLRDYFAGQALVAILSTVNDKTAIDYAERAYSMADAMIAVKRRSRSYPG